MARLNAANNASTTLAADITSAATSITVVDASRFPNPPFRCTIYRYEPISGEIIEVTARSGNTFTTVVRGKEGTTAAAWDSGDLIEVLHTAEMYNELVYTGDSRLSDARTPTAHVHSAADVTSGTLAVARGGTGIASYTTGNFIYASAATTLAQRTPAQVLSDIGAAASTDPGLTTRSGTAPASPVEGHLWYDTTNNVLKSYNGSSWDPVMSLAGGTFSGTVNFADNIAQRPEIKDYAETVYAHGTTGGAKTIDLTNGNIHTITLNAATTFTFSNPPASGKAGSLTLIINQGTTAYAVTWPASVDWAGGSAPDLSTVSTDYVLTFLTLDGGTKWRGWLSGSAFS